MLAANISTNFLYNKLQTTYFFCSVLSCAYGLVRLRHKKQFWLKYLFCYHKDAKVSLKTLSVHLLACKPPPPPQHTHTHTQKNSPAKLCARLTRQSQTACWEELKTLKINIWEKMENIWSPLQESGVIIRPLSTAHWKGCFLASSQIFKEAIPCFLGISLSFVEMAFFRMWHQVTNSIVQTKVSHKPFSHRDAILSLQQRFGKFSAVQMCVIHAASQLLKMHDGTRHDDDVCMFCFFFHLSI